MLEYGAILIVFCLCAVVPAGMIAVASWLGPRRATPVKKQPFECGENPFSLTTGKFSVKFYLVAMLFILFDIELVFLLPWAVLFKELGIFGLVEMGIFLLFLLSGFAYAWAKGALEWQ